MALTKRQGWVRPGISLPMLLLMALLVCLAFAGGASRADTLGQAIVRISAGCVLAVLILLRGLPRPGSYRWPVMLLVVTMALPLIQLIPLPPSLWLALPGRSAFAEVAGISGAAQPWRPIAISPDDAWNAFFSLLVPAASLLLTITLKAADRVRMPAIVLVFVAVSAALAVLQLSGGLDNPFINETVGTATGVFANVNHQALLLAIGILAAGAWVAEQRKRLSWRLPVAGGAVIWFLLMIMASGSRTGLILGFLALGFAVGIAKSALAAMLTRVPRRARWAIVGVVLIGVFALAIASFTAGRAVSLDRLFALSMGEDMRSRALPTVLHMIGTYMPFGAGFGSFDPLFRMHEPDDLLKLTYFNHAHNDYLEVALGGGIAAVALIVAALGWIVFVTITAWRRDPADAHVSLARFAAAVLVLVALASVVDYPARTPIIMALLAIAAVLANPREPAVGGNALRSGTDRL